VTAYTVGAVVAVLVAVLVDQFGLRTDLLRRRAFWVSYAIILAFQLIVNGILTGLPIVRYNSHDILGARFVWAPVEDIAFGFALVTLTLSAWVWLGDSRPRSHH
jgi:lycopene cyclase domain-containing protein